MTNLLALLSTISISVCPTPMQDPGAAGSGARGRDAAVVRDLVRRTCDLAKSRDEVSRAEAFSGSADALARHSERCAPGDSDGRASQAMAAHAARLLEEGVCRRVERVGDLGEGHAQRLANLLNRLDHHIAVLRRVLAKVPEPAKHAILLAIERSQHGAERARHHAGPCLRRAGIGAHDRGGGRPDGAGPGDRPGRPEGAGRPPHDRGGKPEGEGPGRPDSPPAGPGDRGGKPEDRGRPGGIPGGPPGGGGGGGGGGAGRGGGR
jgi:hypothetical protein